MDTRIRKIQRDLFKNRTKSLLIIVTLFVGMLSVGVVVMINSIFVPDVYKEYKSAVPKDASIKCVDGYDNSLLDEIQDIEGVDEASGRNRITARLQIDSQTLNTDLIAFDSKNQINILKKGDNTPLTSKLQVNELFIDRAALKDIGKMPGDTIQVIYQGVTYDFIIKEMVYDATSEPYMLEGDVISFINQESFSLLTGDSRFNEVNITIEGDHSSQTHNLEIAKNVASYMERKGVEISEIEVPKPGDFYANEILQAVTIILVLLGSMSVLLGISLIVNNISNMMLQQTKYIGIMKSIGARTHQITLMYLLFILILGFISFLISLPVSAFMGYQVSKALAYMFNMSLSTFRIPVELMLSLLISSFVIPIIASIIPILNCSKKTIYQLLNPMIIHTRSGRKLKAIKIRSTMIQLPSLILISIRNNFRSRLRIVLTVSTLAISGAIMLTVFNLNYGFKTGIEELKAYYVIDGTIILNSFEDSTKLEKLIEPVEGVKDVEGWSFAVARYVENNQFGSKKIKLMGPKPNSKIFNWSVADDQIVAGRQITPNDANSIVITNHLLTQYPNLNVGDFINIKLGKQTYPFKIVGIMNMAGQPADPILIVNYDYLNSLLHGKDQVSEICISTSQQTQEYQQEVFKRIETLLNQQNITVYETIPGADLLEKFQTPINVLILLLLFLAVMLSIVGTIGQSGTLNLNVLERAKEFGIMRSIGATNQTLNNTIVIESIILGLTAWLFAIILCLPTTFLANSMLGNLLFTTPLAFQLSIPGILLWCIISIVFSGLASILPCLKLGKMRTREILTYE